MIKKNLEYFYQYYYLQKNDKKRKKESIKVSVKCINIIPSYKIKIMIIKKFNRKIKL